MRIGYARTSTQQDEQTLSIEGQIADLEKAGCDKVIAERRSAFRSKRRPGWDELWALVGGGGVTDVLVVDQSRLSRSGDDMAFLELCGIRGTKVTALVGGPIEVESIGGFVQAGILSIFSQLQSRLTAAKVRDGLRRRREAGYYACGKTPYGYRYDGCHVVPDEGTWGAAREMWDQLIAHECNVSGWVKQSQCKWTPRGVRKWMTNPILRGVVRGEHGATKPLITWQEWSEAQHMMSKRSVIRGQAARRVHLFTGLVVCEDCGKTLHTVTDRKRPRLKCMSRICSRYGQGIRADVVRKHVITALAGMAERMAALVTQEAPEPAEAGTVRGQLDALRLAQSMGVEGLEDKIADCQRQLQALRQVNVSARYELLSELFADPSTMELATDEELRAVILQFVESLVWPGGVDSLLITLR